MVTVIVTGGQSDENLRMDLEAKRDFKPVLASIAILYENAKDAKEAKENYDEEVEDGND